MAVPTVAFTSTQHVATGANPFASAEIYLMDDATLANVRRITDNQHYDGFPVLSPDGRKIILDSDMPAEGRPPSTYYNPDLWVMNADGTERQYLDHGASGTWSRDGRLVAYHASASGTGTQIRLDPSAATIDSDIFVVQLDDVLAGVAKRVNLTNSTDVVDEDPDWSPVADLIVYTSHSATSNQNNPLDAEIYVRRADGTGDAKRLTHNGREERAPAWSPDGKSILHMCREYFDDATQAPVVVGPDFELCIMNADGTGQRAITDNTVGDLTPNWSADGAQIFFHRNVDGFFVMFRINADGSGALRLPFAGHNAFANAGVLRVKR